MYSTYKIHVSCMYGCTNIMHIRLWFYIHIYMYEHVYIYTLTSTHTVGNRHNHTCTVGFHHHRDVVKQLHILKCRGHVGVILRPTSGEASEEESKQWPNKQLKLGEELCSD